MSTPLLTNLRCRIPSIEITRNHAIMAVLLCNVIYFGYFIAYGLVIDAKFWYDELFTVGNALRSFPDMLHLVLGDNHPPLYPVFIHFWMQLVPKDEFAARLPSMIFGIGSVWAIWQLRKTSLPRAMVLIAMILLTSNYLWMFHALEARGYALLLFLTTSAVVLYIRQKPIPLILVGVLLGLVHFFGTLVASLFFAVIFFTPRQSLQIRIAAAISQVIVSVYPFYHLFFGPARGQVGGNFWIDEGPIDTVATGLSVAFPWFGQIVSAGLVVFGLDPALEQDTPANDATLMRSVSVVASIIVVMFLVKGYQIFRESYACIDTKMRMRLLVVGAIGLAAVSVISVLALHTPMGSARNFIVLVPMGSLLGAWFIYTFFIGSRINAAVGIVALSLISMTSAVAVSYTLVKRWDSSAGLQPWSIALYDQVAATTGKLYYIPVPDYLLAPHLSRGEEAMFNYYMPEKIEFIPISQEQVLDLPRGSTIGFLNLKCIDFNKTDRAKSINSLTAYLDDNGIDHTFVAVETAENCSNGHVVLN